MHTSQISPTDTLPLALESTHSGLCWDKKECLGAGNLSALIFSIPADVAVISHFYEEPAATMLRVACRLKWELWVVFGFRFWVTIGRNRRGRNHGIRTHTTTVAAGYFNFLPKTEN